MPSDKIGYSNAINQYTSCQGTPGAGDRTDNHAAVDTCYKGATDFGRADVGGFVTNSTACIDGYVDGWKHWCKEKDGVQMATTDLLPGWLINDNKTERSVVVD